MNAKERFLAALSHAPVDRRPVTGVVTAITVDMMEAVKVRWPEAHFAPDLLARLAAAPWEVFGIECIKLPFDMAVEAEALGVAVDFGTEDTLPQDYGAGYNHPDELTIPDDFFSRGRVPIVLEAIGQLRRRYDNEVAVVSSIVGPFTLAAKLFGFENLFPWVLLEPDTARAALAKTTALSIRYARAQLEAGADVILIGEASCSGDLISWKTYQDLIAPCHAELCAALAGPAIVHICGKTTHHLPFIAQTGVAGYSFDENLDITQAREHLKGKVALIGYVPTVEALLSGTPDTVYEWAVRCLDAGVDVLNAGCSLPPHVPKENLMAMVRAAHTWRPAASPLS